MGKALDIFQMELWWSSMAVQKKWEAMPMAQSAIFFRLQVVESSLPKSIPRYPVVQNP
jgi:hypothetical protein